MRIRILLALGGLVASTLILAARSGEAVDASTALRLGLPELTERAALILEGRVLEARALETPEGLIETEYRLAVERTLLGHDLAERQLRLPGGLLPDGRGLALPGMPRIAAGEDVLLFLSEPAPSGRCMPIGLAQGKFGILTHADGQRTLVRELGRVGLASVTSGEVHHGSSSARVDYAAALAEIHAALERRARTR